MYLSYLDPSNWSGNLVAIKAYLLTQNLLKTQLWLWTDSIDTIVNDDTRSFFHTFSDVVTVKTFSWNEEIEGTPLAGHAYFSNYTQLRTDFEDFLAGYGDLVRHVLLYNYGGLWIDTDVVLLQDVYPITMQVILHIFTCIVLHGSIVCFEAGLVLCITPLQCLCIATFIWLSKDCIAISVRPSPQQSVRCRQHVAAA